jgi:hypothetical protein
MSGFIANILLTSTIISHPFFIDFPGHSPTSLKLDCDISVSLATPSHLSQLINIGGEKSVSLSITLLHLWHLYSRKGITHLF